MTKDQLQTVNGIQILAESAQVSFALCFLFNQGHLELFERALDMYVVGSDMVRLELPKPLLKSKGMLQSLKRLNQIL